jgi:hypothetical protein
MQIEFDQLKQDVLLGKIGSDQLLDLIGSLQRQLQSTQIALQAALKRIEELEKRLGEPPPTDKVDQAYSMKAEERRQKALDRAKKKKARKNRRVRVSTAEKIALAQRQEDVYPIGLEPGVCQLSHTRVVWRLENGQAVLVAYRIYRGPQNRYGQIPGVLGRSEYGQEIVVAIAFLVQIVGLSFDKVCLLLQFFQNLNIQKSQIDALLRQLSKSWEQEFENLCTLLANASVVNTDETSWSIHSVWAFLSEQSRVVLYGVHKDAETLQKILDPAVFSGLVLSDNAAVYAQFSNSQKCWSHLIRKGIKLTLQDPTNAAYRHFTDELRAIYKEACEVQSDRRLNAQQQKKAVAALEARVVALCQPICEAELSKTTGLEDAYRLLNEEVMRLVLAEQLFEFVTASPVQQPNGEMKSIGGTNNEAERTLRFPAEARKTGRTNKTLIGARRQTVLKSVLESLRLYLSKYTLQKTIEEINRWAKVGQSCFAQLLEKLKIPKAESPLLDQLFPKETQPLGIV